MNILQEMRKRQVFQLVGLYVVGAWVVIEVASVFFPAWGIPDTALRFLFVAATLLFPIVVLFGWVFDVKRDGVYRTTQDADGRMMAAPLHKRDYVVLSGLSGITIAVLLTAAMQVWNSIDAIPGVVEEAVPRAENSVAILPFANLDMNPDTGHFSDGVAEEILHRLSTIRAVHVLGRSSSFAFRDSGLELSEISKLLAVEYLLEGSVRRDGDLVRVTARLTDQSGVQVWSETFDRKLEAIFVIQSEIAGAVASRIAQEIISTREAPTVRSTDSIEAYDEYLLGKKFAHDRTAGWHAKAREAFRRALELDPDYAPAQAGLAYALFVMAPDLNEESFEEGLTAANRSIELDPNLAEGHAILGLIKINEAPDSFDEGITHLRRALELDASLGDAYNWLSMALNYAGQYDEADLVAAQGHAVDPLLPSITHTHAMKLSDAGEFNRALRILERHTRLPAMTNPIIDGLSEVNFQWGRYADSLSWWPDSPAALEALGLYAEADKRLTQMGPGDLRTLFAHVLPSLHSRGGHGQAWAALSETLLDLELGPADLGPAARNSLLITQVKAGLYDEAIDIFETVLDADPTRVMESSWVIRDQDALNALAFAYLKTGDAARAAPLLDYRDEPITRLEPLASPHFLEPMALNAALRGDIEEAYVLLSRAVDLGWANYYMTINDPRWGDTLEQPRFVALLERVQENLAEQRAEVEAMLADAK